MSTTPERPSESPPQGISLEELSAAFARVMSGQPELPLAAQQAMGSKGPPATGSNEVPEVEQAAPPESVPVADSTAATPAATQQPEGDDEHCQISPRTILEAMLFVGDRQNEPLGVQQASELMRGVKPEEIPALVEELNRRYRSDGCPYEICREGDGYRMALREEYVPIRNRLYGRTREARLSQAAIDVLAIIAYRQPLSGDEVRRARGKPSGHVLAQLVRRQLLRIDRSDSKAHEIRYRTTNRFLALFGLESLDDLPQSDEIDKR